MSAVAGIKLIVGLGNPGAQYAHTRHNVGFCFVDTLQGQSHIPWHREAHFFGFVAKLEDYFLFKPTTFMNDSGRAVSALAHFYKLTPDQILIAHDELDLPVGTIRLKFGGGHGGHNGLRSIIQHLNSNDFYRLRIGISHPGHKDQVTPYVLSKASATDQQQILKTIDQGIMVIPDLIRGDIPKAVQTLHSSESL